MSFPRYPKYRDSGVEWLGEVPKHWVVTPIKRQFEIIGGSTPRSSEESFWDGEIPWATPADLSKLSSMYLSETERKITSAGLDSCGTSLAPAGSLVLSTRAPIGSIAITTRPMCTNQGCKSLVPIHDAQTEYFARLLSVSTEQLNLRGRGTTFLELSGDALGAFTVPLPPSDEQWRIAAFLDRETSKIDQLVAEQERLMELLKEKRQSVISDAVTKGLNPDVPMKPSGVEWLGEVPAHWRVEPVAARFSVQLGKMLDTAKIAGKELRPYLRVIDVQWGVINTEDLPRMDFDEQARRKFSLLPGDLLVNEGGSYPGRSAIWTGELGECYYQKALHRLRPLRTEADSTRFLYYVMSWAANAGVFAAGGNEATIEHLPAEKLRRYRFGFPGVAEQLQIADYLDSELAKFNALLLTAESAVGLLGERRSALISAAVTGQIDVRHLAAEEAAA